MRVSFLSMAVAAALVTAASAPAQVVGDSSAPDGISWGTMGAWGSSWRSVLIGRDGNVVIRWYDGVPPPVSCAPPETICPPPLKGIHTTRFTIGTAGFDRIRTILAPLESKAANRRGKTCGITDVGSASIGWRIDGKNTGYSLGIACKQAENQQADALDNAAKTMLNDLLTAATDRTETVE